MHMHRSRCCLPVLALALVLVGTANVQPSGATRAAPRAAPALDGSLVSAAERITGLETPANLGPGARIVFIGDSLGDTVASGLVPVASARGARVVQDTAPGCSTIDGLPLLADGSIIPWGPTCLDYLLGTWRAKVARTPADAVVWLSSFDASNRLIDDVRADPATPDGRQRIADLIVETAEIVAAPGTGRRVVLLLPAPVAPSARHGEPNPQSAIDVRRHRAILHLVVQHDPARFSLLPLARFLCPRGAPCPAELAIGIAPRAADGGHLTPEGSAWLAPRLLDALGVR